MQKMLLGICLMVKQSLERSEAIFLIGGAALNSAFNIRLLVNSSVDDEIQTADEPTGTEELQENATEVTEERQESATKGTEGRQENATEPQLIDEDLKSAGALYKLLSDDASKVEQVCSADVLSKIAEKLEGKRKCMQNQRTAFLWMQYMGMVDILRKFIRAERTGNWNLLAVHEMLPYFAACGHNLYPKSAYIYLQLMNDLQKKHPEVYNSFQDGLHVVRRSDRYWAGLSTDLVIEQVFMRSVKTCGGLTRGRGMSETQPLVWLLSMPACADVNNAMQNLTGVRYHTSEQHEDTTQARQERDHKDTNELIMSYLSQRNPFSSDPSLRSITTGVVASEDVNAEKAKEVGEKKDQVVILASKNAVRLSDRRILLFQSHCHCYRRTI